MALVTWVLWVVLIILVLSIRQINEYERGVKFRLGKYSGIMGPGWRIVIPVFERYVKVDLRTVVVDVPGQESITKDNVSVKVNAVLYYKVSNPEHAVLQVESFHYAVSQLAQTTMRDIVGATTLDELLSQREKISNRIKKLVDEATNPWGIKVESVDLKDIELPTDMKRVMAKEAEAEREKRAVVIKAEGEVMAAKNMSKAAAMLSKSDGALHLRTLQSINDLSSDQSNTIIFAVPIEVLKALEGMGKKK